MRASRSIQSGISGLLVVILVAPATWATLTAPEKTQAVRWEESQPGCTFSQDDDGKYRYGFWTADFGIVLSVDSRELEKARRRAQPIFALQLTVIYRGKESLDVVPSEINLEFVKHYHDVHRALEPDTLASKLQNAADVLAKETQREIGKHPAKKEEKETALSARQKDAAEMIDFLNTRSLQSHTLNPGNPEATGWVLFGITSKWIDGLQKQEEFVLRAPFGNRIVEFPFSLPPGEGDLILRRRPEN